MVDPYSYISGRMSVNGQAELDINDDDGRKNVHYVFVPQESSVAVSAFGAQSLSYTTANQLASRYDNGNTVAWSNLREQTQYYSLGPKSETPAKACEFFIPAPPRRVLVAVR